MAARQEVAGPGGAPPGTPLRIGTRGSPLALWQATYVAAEEGVYHDWDLHVGRNPAATIPTPWAQTLATGAARFAGEVEQVRIFTPDKDLGQCLRGTRVVQVDWRGKSVVDEEALLRRRGIRPPSIPDLLALTGDDADGIPGLPGFGEKSASALLAKFVHLEHIPASPSAWPAVRQAPRLAATLEAHREDALLYRRLATLRTDAPIGTLEETRFLGVPRDRFLALCDALGTSDLRDRPRRWAGAASAPP